MDIRLYTHAGTPATQINPPIFARCGNGEWYVYNAGHVSHIPAPAPDTIDSFDEAIMIYANNLKREVASAIKRGHRSGRA